MRTEGFEKSGTSIVTPSAIKTVVAPQTATRVFFSSMESGSRAQTITCDSQGAHYQVSFARVGSPTKTFDEGENTMLIDEANGRVGSAAKGSGDIKDTTTLANRCSGT